MNDIETHLRQQGQRLEQLAFTDFELARQALEELEKGLTPRTAFDIRLLYHQYAAFLENQWDQYDKALEHLEQLISILESLADPLPLAEAWTDAAAVYVNMREWTPAQECLDQARKYLKDNKNERIRAHIACREGFWYLHLGNLRQAVDNLLEARTLFSALDETAGLKDYYILTLVLNGLGELYGRLNEKENSLDAYRRVLPIVEKYRLRPRLAWHYLNAGRAALAENNAADAQTCFESVLHYAEEGDREAKYHALANLGILASMKNDVEVALNLLNDASAQFSNPVKPADYTNLSKIEMWRAGLSVRMNVESEAVGHLRKAYKLGRKGLDLHHQRQICQMLAELYAREQKYKGAFVWQSRATQLTEDHFAQVQDRERREIEVRHAVERSRQESQMARLRVVGLQSRALRAQMNPHFLFNALNAIQGFITSGRDGEAATYLARFAKLMRQTLDYSDLEVAPLEQEIKFISQYLEINRKLRFRDRLNFQVIPPADADLDDLYLPTMIIQPFVENAIEHGLRPKQEGNLRIEFQVTEDETMLRCIIEDDGIGINKGREKHSQSPEFQTHRSRGMDITHDRLSLLHRQYKTPAMLYVQTIDLGEKTNGAISGTRVEVMLPLLESVDPTPPTRPGKKVESFNR